MTYSKFARDGKDLYAVAILHRTGKGVNDWKPQLHHIHADSQAQAEIHFKMRYPDRTRTQIVAAGVVIGAKVADKKGDKLII